ncbi:hypothetical protein B2G88_12190 [Natronolimnobius baerhuensis]|uniref:Uncharacterized protein n=2 Tax=Natronolimnobius baerhuensis TaxID=253108 RepID=A0A202EA54_9EURY|nr:hypothetical protein B2G88_12190 [Natronolimnobius baerhuensis]
MGISLALLALFANVAVADETPPPPIDSDDDSEVEDVDEGAEYTHAMTDDVRIVDYYETEEGALEVVIDADDEVSGTYTDDGVTDSGPLPPVQSLYLEEGRNTVTIDVREHPVATITVDGERYQASDYDGADIQTETEEDRSLAGIMMTGIVIFTVAGAGALAIRKIRKNSVTRMK